MRPSRSALSVLLALTACQAPTARPEYTLATATEATAHRGTSLMADSLAEETPMVAADSTELVLAQAALRNLAVQRRTALRNIANVNTPGYKRRVTATPTTGLRGAGDSPLPVASGEEAFAVFTGGPLQVTKRQLDLAIDGDGFFAVTLPSGCTAFTRNSVWHLNADGKIVTGEGHVLLPEITVPNDMLELSIDPRGQVGGRTAGSPDTTTMFGSLTLHRFVNPEGLRSEDSVWMGTDSSGAPISGAPGTGGLGLVQQGCVERSNVELGNELLTLQAIDHQHRDLVQVLRKLGMLPQ